MTENRVRAFGAFSTSVAFAIFACVACGSPRPGGAVGVSTSTPMDTRGSGRDAGAVMADAGIPSDFRASFVKANRARLVSKGHAADRWDVDVYVSPAAKDAFTAPRGELPVGTQLVKEHFERFGAAGAGDTPHGPIMMMEKKPRGFDPDHGDWRYVVLGASGDIVKDGPIESCKGCHDDAPHDHVFRVE